MNMSDRRLCFVGLQVRNVIESVAKPHTPGHKKGQVHDTELTGAN